MIFVLDMTFFRSLWKFLLCNIFSSQAPMVFPRNLPLSHFRTVSVHDVHFFPQPPFLSQKKRVEERGANWTESASFLFSLFLRIFTSPFFLRCSHFRCRRRRRRRRRRLRFQAEKEEAERGEESKTLSLSLSSSPFRSPKLFPFLLSSFAEKAEGRGAISPVLYLSLSLSLSLEKCLASSGTLCVGDCRSKDGGDFGIPSKVFFLFPGKRPPPRLRTPRRTRSSWPRCW